MPTEERNRKRKEELINQAAAKCSRLNQFFRATTDTAEFINEMPTTSKISVASSRTNIHVSNEMESSLDEQGWFGQARKSLKQKNNFSNRKRLHDLLRRNRCFLGLTENGPQGNDECLQNLQSIVTCNNNALAKWLHDNQTIVRSNRDDILKILQGNIINIQCFLQQVENTDVIYESQRQATQASHDESVAIVENNSPARGVHELEEEGKEVSCRTYANCTVHLLSSAVEEEVYQGLREKDATSTERICFAVENAISPCIAITNSKRENLSAVPFYATFFSDDQIEVILRLGQTDLPTIHLDSTGSVVRRLHSKQTIYLYSAVVGLDAGYAQIFDFISDRHDTASVAYHLINFRRYVIKKVNAWPIFMNVVTDHSMAMINAVLTGWIGVDLRGRFAELLKNHVDARTKEILLQIPASRKRKIKTVVKECEENYWGKRKPFKSYFNSIVTVKIPTIICNNDQSANGHSNICITNSNIPSNKCYYEQIISRNCYVAKKGNDRLLLSDFQTLFGEKWPQYSFNANYIFFPLVVNNNHYCLITVDNNLNKIFFYNPLGSSILQIKQYEKRFKRMSQRINKQSWENFDFEAHNELPKQMDGHNCGIFIYMVMDTLDKSKPIGNEFDPIRCRLKIFDDVIANSDNMINECLFCCNESADELWIQCQNCFRWVHRKCTLITCINWTKVLYNCNICRSLLGQI
ncbi:hypothetical protein HELRODRAFT_173891 [Helobdella robusta]|uniref:Ubiquitin-like protease family profile domain-containing protein n=1 Tax=Helobdella robusta TaxID=6412 RepID=T1F7C3_HELRO|nr:hypothetical protein HELRODRAFT_173891 [Helobdella robusta]ESO03030.1 hypothetical protein HELRODRAFT_173891 [Helobdella robusta]